MKVVVEIRYFEKKYTKKALTLYPFLYFFFRAECDTRLYGIFENVKYPL